MRVCVFVRVFDRYEQTKVIYIYIYRERETKTET